MPVASTLGASCVGGSKHVLMTASKYAKERKAFGKQIGDFGLMKEKLARMAIQISPWESMVYRSAGNIEAMMSAAAGDKVCHSMKVLRSMRSRVRSRKVYGKRDAGLCRGRGVQISAVTVSRRISGLPRVSDCRINRIFEGTNEIKPHADRANVDESVRWAAKLALIPAAMKLADEILAGPSFRGNTRGVLAEENSRGCKRQKMFLQAAGGAVAKVPRKNRRRTRMVAGSHVVMNSETACCRGADAHVSQQGEALRQTQIL